MTETKPKTKREIESEKKKAKIYRISEELFNTYGYDNTTLQDISRETGFSIGSLYHFFGTKENILLEISSELASFSFDLTNAEKKAEDPYPAIMEYLLAYSQKWEQIGVDLTNNIYRIFLKAYVEPDSAQMKNLTSLGSFAEFIQIAQEKGTFDDSMSPKEATAYIITLCRGLLYEWCLFRGSYSLTQKAEQFLPRIIRTFIREP